MQGYFEKIKELISDIYVKELTEEQIYKLAGYGLIKQLDDHSDLFFSELESTNPKYNKPLFHNMTPDILYVRMYDFSDKSLQNFEDYVQTLDINKLYCILDLRRNVGGKLDCAIRFLKYFLPNKKIVDLKYRKHTESYHTEFSEQAFVSSIVIINNETASASEVVAGSIQYYKKGLIIGQRSCGKSSVQSLIELEQNIFLKLTVAYFYINGEYDIKQKGLVPDIQFKEFKDIYLVKDIDDFEMGQVDYKIAIIQQCLINLKIYDYNCNGIYDINTINALTKFNQQQNIEYNKALSQMTLDALKRVYFEFCYDNINADIIKESKRILMETING